MNLNWSTKKVGIVFFLIVLFSILLIFELNFFNNLKEKTNEKISENLNLNSNEIFSVIVLPDTQFYSKNYPIIFQNQTKWIIDNKDKLNIKMVIHEGDVVNDWNDPKQWQNALNSFSNIKDIDTLIVPGNHDINEKKNYDNYKKYFGESNNFKTIIINGKKYIFIGIDFCPNKKDIDWANEVLNNHSDDLEILVTHGYLGSNGERNIHECGSTEYIWDDLIKNHSNLQIVFSGHVHAESRRVDKNLIGKNVYQILADYQADENGGNGYLRVLEFNQLNNVVEVKTYSPYLNKFKTGNQSEFVINFNN